METWDGLSTICVKIKRKSQDTVQTDVWKLRTCSIAALGSAALSSRCAATTSVRSRSTQEVTNHERRTDRGSTCINLHETLWYTMEGPTRVSDVALPRSDVVLQLDRRVRWQKHCAVEVCRIWRSQRCSSIAVGRISWAKMCRQYP